MLRKEQNDLLTQTGPGTPMGQLFRSYWMPALLAEELPENDCPPVRVKLLSERLLAFRDSDGRYGLIDEFCAHRGVSLWFGRNEECGLRCPYHGWKYDVTGQCIEVPSEPAESGFCQKIKLKSYPLVEARRRAVDLYGPARAAAAAAGVGVRARCRPSSASSPSACRNATGCRRWRAASIPATSRSCIAATSTPIRCSRAPRATSTICSDMQPVFEVVESAGGLYIGARRNAENGNYYWRITPVGDAVLHHDPAARRPSGARPLLGADRRRELLGLELRLPSRRARSPTTSVEAMQDGQGHPRANTCPGTYRPLANKDNDYLMDRAAQKARRHLSAASRASRCRTRSLQESMGPIVDRTKENLVSTDNGIIMARHRLMRAAKALAEKGIMPPGVDPAHQRVRSAAVVLPPDQAVQGCRQGGAHGSRRAWRRRRCSVGQVAS